MHTHNVYIKLVRTLYKRHLFLSRLWLLSKILRNLYHFKSWAELRKFKVQTSVFRTWWKDDSVRITLRKLKKNIHYGFRQRLLLLKIIVFMYTKVQQRLPTNTTVMLLKHIFLALSAIKKLLATPTHAFTSKWFCLTRDFCIICHCI